MIYNTLRNLLFSMEPEEAHYFTLSALQKTTSVPLLSSLVNGMLSVKKVVKPVEIAGLKFSNSVGLAAGFDKDAGYFEVMQKLGFGHIEVGTVTPMPQPGNDKPRLFRLPKDKALINRLGFNNNGVDVAANKLQHRSGDVIIGGNIGKNKVTANEDATKDYQICFRKLADVVDYFTVNVSSPNTPGLRELQEKGPLLRILMDLQEINFGLQKPRPIFLKIAPDLTDTQILDIVEIVQESKIQGVIATNTTIDRSGLSYSSQELDKIGAGGLSGMPLKHKSTEVLRKLKKESGGSFHLIGVGGILSAQDALGKKEAGAELVQLYTGFIYKGPQLLHEISSAW